MLMSLLGFGLAGPRFGQAEPMISSAIALLPFVIADGESWQDQAFYAQYTDPDTVLDLPDGYMRTGFAVTLTQEEDMLSGAVVVASSALVNPGDHLRMRLEATAVKAGAPDLSWDVTINGRGVHVAPVARTGVYDVALTQGEDPLFVPWDALFEPSVAGRSLGDITATLSGAPAGVIVLPGGLEFVPSLLALQVDTILTVVAENDNPAASEPKSISLSVTQNIIEMTAPLTIAQGYAGGQLLELTNRDAAQDLSNWPGSAATDYVVFTAREDGVGVDPLAISALLKVGSQYQTFASLWAEGTGPSIGGTPKLTVMSNVMTVTDWLSVVDVNGDGSQWNLIVDPGPPDEMVVRGLEIDGRAPKGDLTVGALRASHSALLETHLALAPTYAVDAQPGDPMQLYQPIIVGPHNGPVTRSTDVLRNMAVVESNAGSSRILLAADDGMTIATRTSDTAPNAGNSPLVTTSPDSLVEF